MSMFSAAAVAVFGALLSLILKKQNAPAAFVLSAGAAAILAACALQDVFSVIDKLNSFSGMDQTADSVFVAVKALGIVLLARFTASLCEEAGEKAIAFAVQLFSKISVAVLALPLFDRLMGLLGKVMEIS